MISPEFILIAGGALKSLLLLLSPDLIPKDDFEGWLEKDGFDYSPEKYGDKKFVFDELVKVKGEFRQIMNIKMEGKSIVEIYNLLEGQKIRISKLRLIIDHEVSYVTNLHTRSGIKYVIARTYWIDNNGKKVRRFSKNLGPAEKVYKNGKNGEIPQGLKDLAERELNQTMWERYREEYKE